MNCFGYPHFHPNLVWFYHLDPLALIQGKHPTVLRMFSIYFSCEIIIKFSFLVISMPMIFCGSTILVTVHLDWTSSFIFFIKSSLVADNNKLSTHTVIISKCFPFCHTYAHGSDRNGSNPNCLSFSFMLWIKSPRQSRRFQTLRNAPVRSKMLWTLCNILWHLNFITNYFYLITFPCSET